MVKYNCVKCGKEFAQKSHYTQHINKKNPCVYEENIEKMIEKKVDEKVEAKLEEKISQLIAEQENAELNAERLIEITSELHALNNDKELREDEWLVTTEILAD